MEIKAWGYIAIVALTLGVIVAKKYFPGYKDDNVAEEIAEEVIKETTGVDEDLTPDSPEIKDQSVSSTKPDEAQTK